ncbi:MAG: hypothetical protein WCE93_05360 [Nitrososphaeraceae archaeon]
MNEIDYINKQYTLVGKRREKIIPCSGSAANAATRRYLVEYRRKNPFSELPSFVRKKWGNVKAIEKEFPKKQENFFVKCKYCNSSIRLTSGILRIIPNYIAQNATTSLRSKISEKTFMADLLR